MPRAREGRFRNQRAVEPRARAQSGRAPRGDQGMEPLMNYANGLGNRAPQLPNGGVPMPNPGINGEYRGPGIRTRLGGVGR